jgi:hypothetical protein
MRISLIGLVEVCYLRGIILAMDGINCVDGRLAVQISTVCYTGLHAITAPVMWLWIVGCVFVYPGVLLRQFNQLVAAYGEDAWTMIGYSTTRKLVKRAVRRELEGADVPQFKPDGSRYGGYDQFGLPHPTGEYDKDGNLDVPATFADQMEAEEAEINHEKFEGEDGTGRVLTITELGGPFNVLVMLYYLKNYKPYKVWFRLVTYAVCVALALDNSFVTDSQVKSFLPGVVFALVLLFIMIVRPFRKKKYYFFRVGLTFLAIFFQMLFLGVLSATTFSGQMDLGLLYVMGSVFGGLGLLVWCMMSPGKRSDGTMRNYFEDYVPRRLKKKVGDKNDDNDDAAEKGAGKRRFSYSMSYVDGGGNYVPGQFYQNGLPYDEEKNCVVTLDEIMALEKGEDSLNHSEEEGRDEKEQHGADGDVVIHESPTENDADLMSALYGDQMNEPEVIEVLDAPEDTFIPGNEVVVGAEETRKSKSRKSKKAKSKMKSIMARVSKVRQLKQEAARRLLEQRRATAAAAVTIDEGEVLDLDDLARELSASPRSKGDFVDGLSNVDTSFEGRMNPVMSPAAAEAVEEELQSTAMQYGNGGMPYSSAFGGDDIDTLYDQDED